MELYSQKEVRKLATIYRIVSLICSNLIYWFYILENSISIKRCVIAGITVSACLLMYLYRRYKVSKAAITVLLIVEVIWNSIFIMISGGLSSPYIWYSISSLILIVFTVPEYWSIITIVIYIIAGMAGTGHKANENYTQNILIAIGYLLVMVGFIMIGRYSVRVDRERKKYRMLLEIYDSKIAIDTLLGYVNEVNHISQSMLVQIDGERHLVHCYHKNFDQDENKISKLLQIIQENDQCWKTPIREEEVVCDQKEYTMIYYDYKGSCRGCFVYHSKKKPKFIQEYIELMMSQLRKMDLEAMGEELLISEEQNRIAEEMHDIILQKLFAISCSAYVLEVDSGLTAQERIRQLGIIRKTADHTMNELRETIHGLRWQDNDEDTFIHKVTTYFDEIRELYKVELDFHVTGELDGLRDNQRTALYRIMCESVNNAVRHGQSSKIEVGIEVNNGIVKMSVSDNGVGFVNNTKTPEHHKSGNGLKNMYRLSSMLHGRLMIDTERVQGTKVVLEIPISS